MPPTLPQNDSAPVVRAAALEAERQRYRFSTRTYVGLSLCALRPKTDGTPAGWSPVLDGALEAVLQNDLRADRITHDRGLGDRAAELWSTLGELVHGDLREASNDVMGLLLGGDADGEAKTVGDYTVFFRTLPVPELARHLDDDVRFSRRWLAGSNPESLERMRALDPAFPTDRVVLAGDSIDAALAEGRLYEVDYRMMDGLPPNTLHARPIRVAPARGLLVRPRDAGVPRLVAIRLAADGPVFVPEDGWGWRIARAHLAAADTICGAVWFHHARTHLVAEPLLVAAHRSLAPSHPLMVLLAAHAEGTLYINEVGAHSVFAPHGLLDWFTGTSRDGVRALARRSISAFDFGASRFPDRLAARGMTDPALAFPFRDDGMLVWNALRSWACAYLGLYYPTDGAVAGDTELRAWVRSAGAPDGGGIRGLGCPSTQEDLVELVTQLLFSVSALHASMNFPVAEELTVIPASPFGIWAPPPERTDGWTEEDLLDALPPMDAAQRQFDTALLLGLSRVGSLGDYPDGTFADPRVASALTAFRTDLARIEAEIARRNEGREPYVHLMPSRVPPSINI